MSYAGLDERGIEVRVFGRTDTGRSREANQDAFAIADLSVDAIPDGLKMGTPYGFPPHNDERHFALGQKGAVLLVADGMGGAAAGEIAAGMGAATVLEELITKWCADRNNAPSQFAAGLREAVEEANTRIFDWSRRYPEYQGMGSTVTAVGLLGDVAYLAQIGDSRAYLLRGGEAVQLTEDQSVEQQLIEAGARAQASRGRSSNLLLQALGIKDRVDVALSFQELRREDCILVCSDGLTDVVQPKEILDRADPGSRLSDACDALINLANERGGPDNITVILARLDGAGLLES